MARTKKGSKGIGYEYWSPRPGNAQGGAVGSVAKTITHGRERAKGKQEPLKEPTEPEYDPQEYVPPEAEE